MSDPARDQMSEAAFRKLSSGLDGQLLIPGDDGFDEARRVFNTMIDRTPLVILRCASDSDVKRGIAFAWEFGLRVAVKGGGHSVAGHAVGDGALMLDLSSMKTAKVDPDARIVKVGPGLTLADFDEVTQRFGLACPTGIVSMTGLAGLTLGGGLGWLSGMYGLACDNLLSVEIVTADGQLRSASEDSNEDLFWGVRGGGGNFGVVTSFTFRLHQVDNVLGGGVTYPPEQAREALPFLDEFARASPDELTANPSVRLGEDGRVRVSAGVCYAGPADRGRKVLEPLLRFGPPEVADIQVMPYRQLQRSADAGYPSGRQHYWKSCSIAALDEEAAEVVIDFVSRMPSALSGIGLQQMHGAASRVGRSDTVYADREDHYDFLILSQWEDPAESAANIAWTRSCFEAMQPFASGAVYVNNLGAEETGRVMDAYGPNYQRLKALKGQYDPTNLFRLNRNVQPEA